MEQMARTARQLLGFTTPLSAWGRAEEARDLAIEHVSPEVELEEGGREHREAPRHAAAEAVPESRARGQHRGASWRLTWGARG
jgi:hypothetical protein